MPIYLDTTPPPPKPPDSMYHIFFLNADFTMSHVYVPFFSSFWLCKWLCTELWYFFSLGPTMIHPLHQMALCSKILLSCIFVSFVLFWPFLLCVDVFLCILRVHEIQGACGWRCWCNFFFVFFVRWASIGYMCLCTTHDSYLLWRHLLCFSNFWDQVPHLKKTAELLKYHHGNIKIQQHDRRFIPQNMFESYKPLFEH